LYKLLWLREMDTWWSLPIEGKSPLVTKDINQSSFRLYLPKYKSKSAH
jgi:hypothetical protein